MTIRKLLCLAFPQKFRERERISSNEISQMPEICLGHMVILWWWILHTICLLKSRTVKGKNLLSIIQYTIRYWKKRKGHCHSREQNLYLSSDRRFLDKCRIQAKAPGTAIPRAFFVCFHGTRTEAGCCYLFLSNHLQIYWQAILERVWKIIPAICTPHFAVYFTRIRLS